MNISENSPLQRRGGYQLMSFRWVKYQKGENVRKEKCERKGEKGL
jgi:hypothetical protein